VSPELAAALAERVAGHGLPRRFHLDPGIHELELERIWSRSWLLAGLSRQAPGTGDFFRFDLGDYSVVVVRGEDGVLRALHNTCRHRGMPVCGEPSGRVKRWVCPYHQWSYALDGRLLGCGGMEDQLDHSGHGLRAAGVAEIGGLVFVGLGEDPAPIGEAAAELERALAPQGLRAAKVAHEVDYEVKANWKLEWENNRRVLAWPPRAPRVRQGELRHRPGHGRGQGARRRPRP
jgi:Rieske 2Fe-2S family protein